MTRRYTTEIINQIGPEVDIPAPDVGTSSQVMAWIFDTYSMNKGYSVLGVVTGKPLQVGGSVGREEATGRGAAFCTREALRKKEGRDVEGARIAVQGFGNVGLNLADILSRWGATIAAVSDSTGGIHNPKGLDVRAAAAHKRENGGLAGFAGSDDLTNEELLALDCDVLAPLRARERDHARERVRGQGPDHLRGRERADHARGREILEDRGVLVLPDVLANGGGVVVSYFEWVQGLQEYFWKEDEVNERLADIITRAFEETWRIHEERSLSMRQAAYAIGVGRVAEATTTRGLYP